jgi:hypothetical protein
MVDIEHWDADVTMPPLACRGWEHDGSGGERGNREGVAKGFAIASSMKAEGSFWEGRHSYRALR